MPSAQVTITQLPAAGPITGTESVPIVQNGQTVQTTTGAIAASPAQNQTFVTVNQEPTLANSRALSGGTGVTVVDNGAQSTLQINLTGAAASLDSSTDGLQSKNGATMVGRTITGSTGVSVTNGNGVSGNPTIGLNGTVGALAGLAGTGILGIVGGSSVTAMEIFGTSGEIDVANGTGPGNPTIGISDNPVMPGTGAMTLPNGTTAQRPGGSPGQMRYNTQTGEYEVYQGGSWVDISTSAGFVDVYNNGSLVGTQDGINFIPGNGMTYSIVNDPINNRVDVTQGIASSISLTTVNTTNLEVTNLKAKDGTAAGSVANATGIVTLNSSILTTTDINGGTIDGTTIGGSSAAAITGTTVTANTQFNGPGTGLTGTASGLSIGGNAATATNVSAGLANQLIYQSAPSTTAFVTAPTVANTFLEWSGSAFQWSSNPLGTVTSVGLALPAEFTISNSPVTTTGTLTGAWASQTANYIFAAPNGAPGTPSFRAMVAADVPTLNQNTTGQAGSVANSATFTNTGGASAGATFNGSSPLIVDYSTVGAPKADGTGASGTWGIDITGNAGTSTSSTTATNLAGGAAGSIPYQTNSGVTTFLAQSSGVLVGGTTPSYSTAPSLTGTNFSSIPNSALQNSSITIGTTGISLGSSASTLAGLTSVTVTQAPSSALQLATKQYVDDQVSTGIDIHTPVRVETPTALNATYLAGGTSVTVTDIAGGTTLTFSSSPGLSANDQIVFSSTSNGITAGTAYYVYSAPAANQVTLSLSYNGPEITTLTNGTGLTIGGLVNAGVGATLTNAGANAALQIDGITLSATNRVLVYNQANAYENGVYTVTTVGTPDPGGTPWVLTRSTDTNTYKPDSTTGLGQGDYFFVQEGLTGAGESYVLTTSNPLIIGTTNLTFTQFAASQVYSAGTGLTLTGTTFSLTSPVVTSLGGTGLTSYTTGDLLYYSTGTALSKLGIGTSTYLLTSSGSAPQWSDPSGVTVGNATNASTATNANNVAVSATTTNATFYPTFVDTTTGNQAIEVGAGLTFNPSTNTLTTTTFSGALSGNATTATTATNIAGGTANQIPYQTGAGATSFVTAPSVSNTYLEWTGSAFQWSTVTAGVSSVTASAPLASSGGSTPDISLTGTVATGNGGTGLSSYTAGDLIYYATGTAFTKLGIGSSTYLLTSSGTAPQWSDPSGVTVGTATNATNVAVTATSVNATFYPAFVDATTGNQAVEVDTDLTYNPSTNTLTAGTMTATTGIFGGTF